MYSSVGSSRMIPLSVGKLRDDAAAVHEHDLLVALVDFRIADDAHERRQPRAGAEQIEVPPWPKVGKDDRVPVGFLPTRIRIAFLDVLQARSQSAIGYLDAEEFKEIVVGGADDAVCAS